MNKKGIPRDVVILILICFMLLAIMIPILQYYNGKYLNEFNEWCEDKDFVIVDEYVCVGLKDNQLIKYGYDDWKDE